MLYRLLFNRLIKCHHFNGNLLSLLVVLFTLLSHGDFFRNLFELLCRSRPDEKDKVEWYNNRLKDILDGVPVKIWYPTT